MKISIIGSNGLLSTTIGKYCNKLDYQVSVYGLDEPKGIKYDKFVKIDLIKENIEIDDEIINSDMIIYAAGAGIQSNLKEADDLIYNLNVFVPVKLCTALKHKNYSGRFVTFGSYFEFGESNNEQSCTEEELIASTNRVPSTYCVSKRMLTRYISSADLPFTTWHFILPTIYGERENPKRLIPYVINAIKSGGELSFTAGDQVRQYVYIDEIATILIKAYEKSLPKGIYNVAGNETLTVKEIVTKLFNLFGKCPKDEMFGKAQRTDTGMKVLKLCGDKLYGFIGYKPQTMIADMYDRY
jgi:nucleoside-diphosphate-sugar epimerase